VFIAKVFYDIGIKVYNSFSSKPSHIDLNELTTNKNVTLISEDLHSERNENTIKFNISNFFK
jgi:hypothetical protein